MKKIFALLIAIMMMISLFLTPIYAAGSNLITNGDFEAGNTEFNSDYSYKVEVGGVQDELYDPFVYGVGTNPNDYHNLWTSFGDHTSGDGKMMIVNASNTDPEKVVWGKNNIALTLPDPIPAVTSQKLYAGQNLLIGDVLIKIVNGQIAVKFVLNADAIAAGWLITETHVSAADGTSGIPQKNGNPIPGQFQINNVIDPGDTEAGWYYLNIGANWSAPYAVATHAAVKKIQAGYTVSDYLASGAGTDNVLLLPENSLNQGYPQGYISDYQTTYPAGLPSELAWTHSAWSPYGIAGADWISSAYYSETPDNNTWRLFRRSFSFPAAATNISGSLTMNSDNAEVAYVNGTFVGDGSPAIVYGASVKDVSPAIGGGRHGYDSVEGPINISTQLNTGNNELWIMTRNYAWSGGSEANPTALIYKLSYQYDMPPVVLQTETAWGGENNFTGKNWAKYIDYTPAYTPGSATYEFSMWVANSYPTNLAHLQVSINNVVIGTADLSEITAPITGQWKQYKFTWNAGTATAANIVIKDTYAIYDGDDFAIDDITLIKQ